MGWVGARGPPIKTIAQSLCTQLKGSAHRHNPEQHEGAVPSPDGGRDDTHEDEELCQHDACSYPHYVLVYHLFNEIIGDIGPLRPEINNIIVVFGVRGGPPGASWRRPEVFKLK